MPSLVLFPLSYALHVAEEAWGGESFPVWASRLSGASFSREEFVVLNGVAFAVMCIAVALTARWHGCRWARGRSVGQPRRCPPASAGSGALLGPSHTERLAPLPCFIDWRM